LGLEELSVAAKSGVIVYRNVLKENTPIRGVFVRFLAVPHNLLRTISWRLKIGLSRYFYGRKMVDFSKTGEGRKSNSKLCGIAFLDSLFSMWRV
jgi:hypothetical protein